mgnify:CR=1 FL=1
MNKIKTAEEFLKDNFESDAINPQILIEFAKLHVTEALLKASEVKKNYRSNVLITQDILNSYPLTNIK